MKKQEQILVRVKGHGDSKQRTFSNALSQVQKEVLKNTNNILLRIEPIDIQVVSAIEKIVMERFLFIFLPRKKTFYEITLDVSVNVTFIDLNDIEFTSK
ncbi:cytoplasmic protein [Gilliamella sp. Fer1-1]|jgi:uncharacterized protein (TIGR03578 family)|uniref:DUF4312 family protein n=1 Tax=unclassified Gilliamella TaxID=2685620 RepID=UPI00080E3597|nr:DUF4312 family protein [Gilliamella apicola]OCG19505.1 cytoplasmic protein [Gilliamella apicola]OCG26539.1 cytoplasmic protein [Gilliamella apicola]OCG29042.1 cytoplasmic protein [Gilliamella apicola]OCG40368.1 cytoplasmic protein [Gilliamella apicola]OCG44160.1 cytoplasmic protein [Gilliamella apicola]